MAIDAITQAWIRNESDARAAAAGYRFDVLKAGYVVWWIERYCRLYEGEWAGEPMILRGCWTDDWEPRTFGEWDQAAQQDAINRAWTYSERFAAGEPVDWQYECTMRVHGWVKRSDRWKREIRRFRKSGIWVPKKSKKALALDTPIPTPGGWTDVQSIRVGDTLFDINGNRCSVVDKTETYFNRPCYRVHFSNGESVVCDEGHLWVTSSLVDSKSVGSRSDHVVTRPYRVRTTKQIHDTLFRNDGARCHSLQMPKPLDCDEKQLPMDPYILGFWLGDGDSDAGRITFCVDDEPYIRDKLTSQGTIVRESRPQKSERTRRAAIGVCRGHKSLRTQLRKIGVFKNKHIPVEYLRSSMQQRLALLQGLMDTDGCVTQSGECVYATSSKAIKRGVCELLATLGIKFSCVWYDVNSYYRIRFSVTSDALPVVTMPRKLNRLKHSLDTNWKRSRTVQITSVEQVESVPVQCIAIDSPTRQFLFGRTMLPTHNTPTEAGWSLYHTCADGEHGAKCFWGAADGKQAGLAAEHAIAMVEASKELAADCKINKNLKRVTYVPTRSFAEPLSSANAQTQKTKEGLNGSLFIDEAHVVSRSFMDRVDRMGISRSEPVMAMFSTAGDDPDSWGKEQRDYGADVASGVIDDPAYFFAEYAAPQDITDEAIDADISAIGRAANPAWNHTIGEEEFVADYRESCRTVSKLAKFKMYRLNIWQKSSHPWKIATKWTACRSDRTLQSFRGEPCWLGADLSRARDMSAVVATFRDESGSEPHYYQFAWAWMVREYAEKHASKAPFIQWERDGYIEFCDTTIDLRQIEAVIRELAEAHYVREFRHDPAYANEISRRLEEDLGILAVPFRQTIMQYAKPVDDFEAAVTDGTMHHDGNPVYTWEIGHASVKADPNNNRRIVKPTDDDYRKVDIVQAGVMSLSGAVASQAEASIYATSKPFFAGDQE